MIRNGVDVEASKKTDIDQKFDFLDHDFLPSKKNNIGKRANIFKNYF